MSKLKSRVGKSARLIYNEARHFYSAWSHDQRKLKTQRKFVEHKLRELADTGQPYSGTILVEGTWDNPNFWLRYSLVRAALGLSSGREVGVLGPHNAKKCARSFANIGIGESAYIDKAMGDVSKARAKARELLNTTSTPQDILDWNLPYDLPNDVTLYDGILKRQRAALVDLNDPLLEDYVTEALATFDAAANLLDQYEPSLVLLSHASNFFSAAMAVIASQRNIPVVLLFGQYSILRFAKITQLSDIYNFVDCPVSEEIDLLSPDQADHLAAKGRSYLEKRFSGTLDDIGSIYAYKRRQTKVTRQQMAETFGWDPQKPIVGVYASNWFDFPHTFGMRNFRDYLDWLNVTLDSARQTQDVNWLFKSHPCDEWYGGITLKDLMAQEQMDHIQQIPTDWNGADLIQGLDALVTVHSTAGVEFAASGKPVLAADRGWYHDCGFVKWSKTRNEYIANLLSGQWWKDLTLDTTTRRAQIFAGWNFGLTGWQEKLLLEDDSKRDELYYSIPLMLDDNPNAVTREIATIKKWFESPARTYHTFKMHDFLNDELSPIARNS